MGRYYTAQVCLNGHMVVSNTEQSPELTAKFCDDCGAATVTTCPSCRTPIRGYYYVEGVISFDNTPVRAYCHECGAAYPWTEARLAAAKEMADELDELTVEERDRLKGTLDDLIRDTPRTELAATRFKKIVARVGASSAKTMRNVAVELATEAAKRFLLGP